jgi:hypothetical protein
VDAQSYGNFWQAGSNVTGVVFIKDSAVSGYSAYASDATNTVDSSADALYKAVTGAAFLSDGGPPWSAIDPGCIVTFESAYAGVGAPQSAPSRCLARIVASVVSAAGGLVGLAVSNGGDVIGQDLTYRIARNSLVDAPAGVITHVTTERMIDLPLAADTTIQPVFAADSGDDLTIQTLVMTLEPIEDLRGW